MNRSNLIGLAVIGALGLAVGLWQSGIPVDPPGRFGVANFSGWPRQEFPLLEGDGKADGESPALAVDSRGRVLLAFASRTGPNEQTIYLARARGRAAFDEPTPWRKVPTAESEPKRDGPSKPAMTDSAGVLPRLASSGDAIWLGWVEAIEGGPGAAFYVARSVDGGRTFSEPVPVRGPGASKPGCTAIAADPAGRLDAAWIDGPEGGREPFASGLNPDLDRFEAETPVHPGPADKGVCPRCDLALARPEGGSLFVAFRGIDDDLRDIRIARSRADGAPGFEPPVPVGDHRRSSEGCPHDGPTLALAGGRLVVAWMDSHDGRGRIYVADTDPANLSFQAKELDPGSEGSQEHPRIIADGKRGLIAAWDESLDPASTGPGPDHAQGKGRPEAGEPGRAIRVATSADGRTFVPSRPVDPRPGASQLNPAIAVLPDGEAIVAWGELTGAGKRVVVARIKP